MEEPVVEKTDEQQLESELGITPEVKKEQAPAVVENPAEGTPAAEKPAEDDLEFDLGFDVDGKTPLKLKKSQILDLKKGGMLQADYTVKTQEIAAEKANLKEVVDIIEYLKKNPKKAEKIVAILEEKAEETAAIGDKLEDKADDIDDLLKDLPEDDPYAKALRAQRAQIQQAITLNKQLQDRLGQFEQKTITADESKIQAEADQTLQEVIASTQKSLVFTTAKEGEFWKKTVLTYLINSPQEYAQMDKAQFEEYFKKIAQNVYAEIKGIGEGHVAKYIKSKTGGPGVIIGPGGTGGVLSAAPNAENLQGSLETALKEEESKNT